MNQPKMFPLKLPENYHGPVKPFETTTQQYSKKIIPKDHQPEELTLHIAKWQRKISDLDVIHQRQQYLVHPAKISTDNPDWLKSTYHYYHRSQSQPYRRETKEDRKKFDVFGRKKTELSANRNSESTPFITKENRKEAVFRFIGENQNPLGVRRTKLPQQVASKIGCVQMRTNWIKKPQLKVGSLHENNYVDTYTVN